MEKIRNKKHYWIDPDGYLIREWNETEYSSLLPTDKIEIEMYDIFCPVCKKHKYYSVLPLIEIMSTHPIETLNYCKECGTFLFSYPKELKTECLYNGNCYKSIKVKLDCLEWYELYNEGFWMQQLKLNKE